MKTTAVTITYLLSIILTSVLSSAQTTDNKGANSMPGTESHSHQHAQYVISVSVGGSALGEIVVELDPHVAPKHVQNFDSLVSVKFYDGTLFHRIIPGFMIQGGDPNTKEKGRDKWGMGDPSQTRVPAEFNTTRHMRGVLSAARSSDPNSATSQFFICVDDAPHLDGKYTAYGKVISGMEVADKIVELPRDEKDRPIERVEMRINKR
jgi:peptidyl-prolyl cis-trans isomerase B (cyclophilin B)